MNIACLKSAATGALSGAAVTVAEVASAETNGSAALLVGPLAALAVGGELVYRTALHIDLAIVIADSFGVEFDADDSNDLWQLLALVFGVHRGAAYTGDPGNALVSQLVHEGEEVGDQVAQRIVGESIARNVLPFVGIVVSAAMNWFVTRKIGDTVRRYARYRRAFADALARLSESCSEHIDLLVEGVWFLFTADGRLTPEEAVTLARMLRKLDPEVEKRVRSHFVEDEMDWAKRIESIPEAHRDGFLRALAVAAAVDKRVGIPERKILRRAADHLGREFDMAEVATMIKELDQYGVLRESVAAHA
jgi:hypothetical protein